VRTSYRLLVALAGSALVLSLLPATASGAPDTVERTSSFSVSATQSTYSIVLGGGVLLSGRVSPRSAAKSLRVQELAGGRWTTVDHVRTTSSSTFQTVYRPGSAGRKGVRVCKPAAGSRRGGCSPTMRVRVSRWHYLDSWDQVAGTGFTARDSLSINGRSYRRSLQSGHDAGTAFVEYDLARRCSQLRAVVGMGDESEPRADGQIDMLGDGARLLTRSLTTGTAESVRVPVSDVLRVRVQATTDQDGEYVAVGTPRVLCLF
jgi:hypothetical protein